MTLSRRWKISRLVFGPNCMLITLRNVFMGNLFYFQQKNDARIIVGMFYEDQARRVFCEVNNSACIHWSLQSTLSKTDTIYRLQLSV